MSYFTVFVNHIGVISHLLSKDGVLSINVFHINK